MGKKLEQMNFIIKDPKTGKGLVFKFKGRKNATNPNLYPEQRTKITEKYNQNNIS